jgi:hypothetical protein
MPYRLPMPANLRGWSIKIYDKERLEPPHVTVIHGNCIWRICLRSRSLMDVEQPGCKMHKQVMSLLADEQNWKRLKQEWNSRYPINTVAE